MTGIAIMTNQDKSLKEIIGEMSSEEKDAKLEDLMLKLAEACGLMRKMSEAINEGSADFDEWRRERAQRKVVQTLVRIHAKCAAFENDMAIELEPHLTLPQIRDLLWGPGYDGKP
jgi:hypothetical protein